LGRVRLIIGIICIAISIWMFLYCEINESPAPAIAVLIIGIILIAISRRKLDCTPGFGQVGLGGFGKLLPVPAE
jgi:membrane-bound ClpP family serine protease